MQIAMIHYHLNRGGVTQVMVNHLRSLSATTATPSVCRVAVLFGGRLEGWPQTLVDSLPGLDVTLCAVPELEYAPLGARDPQALASAVESVLRSAAFDPRDTVLHIHNHALGKNVAWASAVALLADAGWALLLQIHDFVEDFRPENYQLLADSLGFRDPEQLARYLYPQGPAIHYALLNGRDLRILSQAGGDRGHLHALPNPVLDLPDLPDRATARRRARTVLGIAPGERYVLYPVRGIRRKNLGELLLWAAAEPGARFGLTLAPLNPAEQRRYAFWKSLSRQLNLPVIFETGAPGRLTFPENVAAADMMLTTSVAEGFGMVFLECWLAGQPLAGRDLPEITADFRRVDVRLDGVADNLWVDVDWTGRAAIVDALVELSGVVLRAYRRPPLSRGAVAEQVDRLVDAGRLDFGRLPARLQADIVRRIARDKTSRRRLFDLNPVLQAAAPQVGAGEPDEGWGSQPIQHNGSVVRREYGLARSGARLRECYRIVLDSVRGPRYGLPNGASILPAFLDLSRTFPVRIEP